MNWHEADNATGDDNSDFSSNLLNESVSETLDEVTGLTAGVTYFWRVRAENPAGNSDWSEAWQFTTGNGAAIDNLTNTGYSLGQNYPNPFTGITTIEFNKQFFDTKFFTFR